MKINFNFEEKNVKLGLENQFTIQEFLETTPVKILMLKGEKGDTVSTEWGTITGDIADQTDLVTELDTKADKSTTYTKTEVDTALETKADMTDIPDVSNFITKDVNNLTNYTKTSDLSEVATSGDYDDLDNKPTIPSKTSDLTNDSGYIDNTVDNLTNYTKTSNLSTVATSGSYSDLSNKPTIPSKTSDLTNDSNFAVTNADNKFSVGQTIAGETVVDSIRTKNIFDKSVVSTVKTFNSSGDIIPLTEGFVQEIYIPVKSSTKYTLSTNGDYTGTTNYRLIFCEYNSSKGFIQRDIALSGTSYTITTTANTKYIRIGGNTVFIDALQLEEGDTATSYSPYQNLTGEENYSIEEIKIGTWIDGKPLYRKVYTSSTYATTFYVSTQDIKELINITGMLHRTDYTGIWQVIPSRLDNAGMIAQFGTVTIGSNTRVDMVFGTNWTNVFDKIYLVLEYTKTTD